MNRFLVRLAADSLTADGSPSHCRAHRCTVFFAGYLSNGADVRRTHGLAADAGEAECVAAAYRHLGAHLATSVLGEYAAVIYDPIDRSLVLVHDALGIRPLFYSQLPHETLVSTELEPLVALTGIGDLDETCLARSLAVVDDLRERTPYRHIHRVPQGASVALRNATAHTTAVYDPAQVKPLRLKGVRDYEERFRELITGAVAATVPPSGKVWCELSGGLDSSTVVSLAAGVLHASFDTYSLGFSRSHQADETPWREVVLQAFSLRSHLLDADGVPPFSTLPQHFQPEPTGTSLVCALDGARRALFLEHGVGYVLTGMCGDAVFLGDSPEPAFLADLRDPWALWSLLRSWEKHSPQHRSLAFWFMRYVVGPRRMRTPVAPPKWITSNHRETHAEVWRESGRSPKRAGLSNGDDYFWDRVLRGALSTYDGQQPFADVCQFRNPWLSLPLVEFMAATPWPVKLQPQSDRVLQRNALRGILPEATRLRVGKGVPTQALIAGLRASSEWHRLLTDRPAIVERGYVKADAWRRAVELARHGLCEAPACFMRACMLEAWFHALVVPPLQPATLQPVDAAYIGG